MSLCGTINPSLKVSVQPEQSYSASHHSCGLLVEIWRDYVHIHNLCDVVRWLSHTDINTSRQSNVKTEVTDERGASKEASAYITPLLPSSVPIMILQIMHFVFR